MRYDNRTCLPERSYVLALPLVMLEIFRRATRPPCFPCHILTYICGQMSQFVSRSSPGNIVFPFSNTPRME